MAANGGAVDSAVAQPNRDVQESILARPARKQISFAELDAIRSHSERSVPGMTYNIWYNKMSGGDSSDPFMNKEKSKTRCNIAQDSGYTRADLRAAAAGGNRRGHRTDPAFCCLFFARGCCPKGADCTFLHRLPRANEITEQGVDVFGREKHGDFRDDMGGVGSMHRVTRTLYVGRINEDTSMSFRGRSRDNAPKDDPGSPLAKIVRRHFSEWGEVTKVRVMNGRGIAFVTYKYEANAQFAKEAMMNQSLDNNEVLNVRWSLDEPGKSEDGHDPEAREQGERRIAAIETANQEQEQDYRELQHVPGIDWDDYARAKRQRITLSQDELARLDEENKRGWEEYQRSQAPPAAEARQPRPKEAAKPAASGLLNEEALKSLEALRKQQSKPKAPAAPPSGLSGLAAYGSDSE